MHYWHPQFNECALSAVQFNMPSNERTDVNDVFGVLYKEEVVAYFKVLSQNSERLMNITKR
jgi:hypothetical protein